MLSRLSFLPCPHLSTLTEAELGAKAEYGFVFFAPLDSVTEPTGVELER